MLSSASPVALLPSCLQRQHKARLSNINKAQAAVTGLTEELEKTPTHPPNADRQHELNEQIKALREQVGRGVLGWAGLQVEGQGCLATLWSRNQWERGHAG
jgi:hypothetical protein